MKKNNKKVNVNVEVAKQDNSFFKHALANVDMFNNVDDSKQATLDKIVTVNNAKAVRIDYMSMSRVAFFRIAVKQLMTVDELKRIDFLFYKKTNDRSRSQKEEKKNDLLRYSHKRTMKQLNDVVKATFAQKLFQAHNLIINTAQEYETAINKLLVNKSK